MTDPASAVLVRLWRFQLDQLSEGSTSDILSLDERARAERLKIPQVRQRFINGRTFIRQTLAAELNIDPAALQFEYTSTGKPYLSDTPLHFNFTHSGDVALLAVADVSVGIDTEQQRYSPAFQAMEATLFTAAEQAFLNQWSGSERQRLFFELWTCKEALVKATGEGFQAMLRYQVQFDESTDDSQALDADGNPIPWLLQSLELETNFSAAVAAAGHSAAQKIIVQLMNDADG